jgi:hypothetical protein
LPPERRTVGQLVAETVRFYGSHFWLSLLLGVGPAVLTVVLAEAGRDARYIIALTLGALVLTLSYVGACVLLAPEDARTNLRAAILAGLLAYLPTPFLAVAFVLPALAWLAFAGLAVPVAVVEGHGVLNSFRRAKTLARADYIHSLGSLAALAIVGFLSQWVLFFLVRGTSDQTARVAAFLASLVISPVLFLGAALLYFDQAARAVSSRTTKRRRSDAEVPDADDPDRAGRADAQVESRPATGGQS